MFFRRLKTFTRDYFTLTSRERKGALSLAMIIFIQCGIIFYLNYYSVDDLEDFEKIKVELLSYEESLDSINLNAAHEKPGAIPGREIKLYPFDPNVISNEEWVQFGLSVKQAATIRNYLNKGGRFRDKNDVAKMYGISPGRFKILEPYITIEQNHPTTQKEKFTLTGKPVKKKVMIELNSADTIALQKLPLVGSGRARMISKYRDLLGGFYHTGQLLEVFTIDTPAFQAIIPYVTIDTSSIRKININSDELKHPYLTKTMVYAIKAYRKQHGDFRNISDLKKLNLVDDQLFDKLAGYIDIQ